VIRYTVEAERWPLKSGFVIARKALTCSHILKVTAVDGVHSGHGEAEAHEDDAELALTLIDALRGWTDDFHDVAGPDDLQALLPPGPARNALDCALWDMMAKRSGRRAWELAGVTLAAPVPTAYSIGIAVPDAMAASAWQRPEHWLLKLKLGDASGETDLARVKAVRVARPDARLIVDANGAWSLPRLQALAPQLAALRVEMIEQPLPVGGDDALIGYTSPIPLCADESCIDRTSLPTLVGRYQAINIKLDKTGGLTEALALKQQARSHGFRIMVGCMVGTSLAMAPAMVVAADADWVDLDGPLLLASDRDPGLTYREGMIAPPSSDIWG
jgi:L-alanine-DL-glutamate epimerase-like enolase superfamily enzyme